jgi:general stress protein 26
MKQLGPRVVALSPQSPSQTMNTFPETDANSLDPKNREQIISLARELLQGGNPGILSTVDQSGFPQSRWMATMSFDDFPDLYTLTSATSRKVAQIQEHPIVNWMFSNQDLSFIVNLTGRAEIYLHEADAMKRIWHQIADKSRAFFLGDSVKGPGFVVIHTKVEIIECTIPRKVLKYSIDPAEMSESLSTPRN